MDQFLDKETVRLRLVGEYMKYNSLVIGFDFDNTVYDYQKKGHTYGHVIELLRKLKTINCKLICWTANPDLVFVEKYLTENKIPFDGINESFISLGWDTVKPFFNALLDDRAGLRSVYDDLMWLYDTVSRYHL